MSPYSVNIDATFPVRWTLALMEKIIKAIYIFNEKCDLKRLSDICKNF